MGAEPKEGGEPPRSEPLYVAAADKVRSGRARHPALLSLIILAIVVAMPGEGRPFSVASVLTPLAAFLVHDLAWLAGMHLLRFSESAQLYFFPFLHRALPSDDHPAEAWRRGLMHLLGVLPGLLMALVLGVVGHATQVKGLGDIGFPLAIINAMWLAPLGFFDGGQLMNIVIFSRSRRAEVIFLAVTTIALVVIALAVELYFLAALGLLGLFAVQRRGKVRDAASELVARFPSLPRRAEDLEDEPMRALFASAHRIDPLAEKDSKAADRYANVMRGIYRQAVLVPPSGLTSALLLALYVACIVLAVAAMVLLVSV